MNEMTTNLTKEDLHLIYLLLHKVPISYIMTTGLEYEVFDLIEKVEKEIDNRSLKFWVIKINSLNIMLIGKESSVN